MVLLLDQFSAVCAIWEEFTKQNQYQSISLSQITFVSKGLNHINIALVLMFNVFDLDPYRPKL